MIFYYVTIGLCIVTYRTVNVTYMRITKYYICLVWIFTQYNFAVFWYYIISFSTHFSFQYTYISHFFFYLLLCRYRIFLRWKRLHHPKCELPPVPGCLLRENYPFNADYKAGYLASEDQARPNPYSYLWPFSGTLSAVNTILEEDASYRSVLDGRVLPGLAEYLDTTRMPAAYASYINTAPASDRFYDDNVWLGIDFCDIYEATGDKKYLAEAEMIWKFIESGTDDVLGGGIYWCEQKKHSKNTCSNAPGTVYALKLYAATGDGRYLEQGKGLYAWTKEHLLDTGDGLYFDNVSLDGNIGRAKFAYNSGQMVQAGALLYKATGDESYLKDAQRTAAACYDYFFEEFTPADGEAFRIIRKLVLQRISVPEFSTR